MNSVWSMICGIVDFFWLDALFLIAIMRLVANLREIRRLKRAIRQKEGELFKMWDDDPELLEEVEQVVRGQG